MTRNCFRCYQDFRVTLQTQRLCPVCRAPRVRAAPRAGAPLSGRERQIAGLVTAGKRNKEIAWAFHLKEGTIKQYLHDIFAKMAVSNRTELAIRWISGEMSQ